MTMLAVTNLSVGYGDMIAVRDVSFSFEAGEVFVLLGANGAGKSSILRCISGLVQARSGTMAAGDCSLAGLSPHQVARAGISHVPEGRRIFPNLTVEENLTVSFIRRHDERERPSSKPCTRCSRGSWSGAANLAERCPVASSKCWRSAVR
jgi:branched-chain amino acid transport system ATP-binding protein